MKKLILIAVCALLCAVSVFAADEKASTKFEIPTTTPAITLADFGVEYVVTNHSGHEWTEISFRAGLTGKLESANVVVNDETRFHWNDSDGHCKGDPKDMGRLQKKFDSIKLPSLKIETSYTTEDSGIGASTDSFELVGSLGSGANGKFRYVLKGYGGALKEVLAEDFMFSPPANGEKFRLGRKLGKLVCLVEKDGKWVIPATDYYSASETKTASK